MFNKMKLKRYLLIVFAAIIALTTLITALSVVGLADIQSNTQEYTSRVLGAESAVKTCRIEANVAARDLREMALMGNQAEYPKFTKRINESQAIIKEQIDIFKETHGEDDGLAQKYEDSFDKWFNIAQRAVTELEQGNRQQAIDIIANECSPALTELVSIVKEIDTAIAGEKESSEKFNNQTIQFFVIAILVLFGVSLLASLYFAAKTTGNIVKTTEEIKRVVTELSKGNLKASVNYQAKNEFGELANLINFSFEELSKYISAIDYGMDEFSKGNFSIVCPVEFLGDFASIQYSIEQFQQNINNTLTELDMAAAQVSDGADQVSGGAQALAQGATEQASSVELLSSNILEASEQISETSRFAENANDLGKRAGEVVRRSQSEMKHMLEAIKDIAVSSESIRKIIKAIDDIAFQTNILALNAAVEAARAGSAGKGFAVVADEVRNLAQKSAEAAKSTTELIDNSLQQVENGEKLAISTDAAFDEVAQSTEEILYMVEKIAHASKEQSGSISQISQGVEQISSVVQMNSATSEQSAAASQELSGQANVMKSLIGQFTLAKYEPDAPSETV